MNCKPGDLAIVVHFPAPFVNGKIVRCVRLAEPCQCEFCNSQPAWFIEEPLEFLVIGRTLRVEGFFDEYLRPIRDQEGQDETLSWAKVPKVPA